MNFIEQEIKGVYLIKPEPISDNRGIFRRHFSVNEFENEKIESRVYHANLSENPYQFTLRGFHYQIGENAEAKTLSCLRGKIYDVVVDLRVNSKTFMKWVSFELDSEKNFSIHIPKGCANAFLTLTNDCLIHYYVSNEYDPIHEKGIRYNDPQFKFIWPASPKIISEKDNSFLDFKPEKY